MQFNLLFLESPHCQGEPSEITRRPRLWTARGNDQVSFPCIYSSVGIALLLVSKRPRPGQFSCSLPMAGTLTSFPALLLLLSLINFCSEESADLVVVADGQRSKVRNQLVGDQIIYSGHTAFNTRVPRHLVSDSILQGLKV